MHYATHDSNARLAITLASGTLTFADQEASKSFTIPILNDDDTTGDRDVTLELSLPSQSAAIGTATATLHISEDDPHLALRIDDVSIAEGNRTAPR